MISWSRSPDPPGRDVLEGELAWSLGKVKILIYRDLSHVHHISCKRPMRSRKLADCHLRLALNRVVSARLNGSEA